MAQVVHFWTLTEQSAIQCQPINTETTMSVSTNEFASSGRGLPRRNRQDRRIRGRLRELCEEVLLSYRMAQGQDLVTPDERDSAEHMLRSLTPRLAR